MIDPSQSPINPYRPYLLRIAEVRDETPDVRTLGLRFVDELQGRSFAGWRPGQFAEYTVFGAGECVFAIANSADENGRACGRCDACRLRREGFAQAGLVDPTRYRPD